MNMLLLVDGHNLLFKAFYGLPERLLADGKPVHGVIGFIGIIVKIINSTDPTHVLVVFDPEEQPSRAQQYTEYKQNRRDFGGLPERENPFSQLADIKRALDGLHIAHVEQPGCEADDMIAAYVSRNDCEVVIVSSDTDFFQLVCERVTMLRYHGKKSVWFDVAEVQRRYGIHPSRFLEYKALTGDKSDNISGIRGVGPKTAVRVLNGEKELITEEREIFERNLGLIKLDTAVDLPYQMHELVCHDGFRGFKVGAFLRVIGVL